MTVSDADAGLARLSLIVVPATVTEETAIGASFILIKISEGKGVELVAKDYYIPK